MQQFCALSAPCFCDIIYPHLGEAGIENVQVSFCYIFYKKQVGNSNAQSGMESRISQ